MHIATRHHPKCRKKLPKIKRFEAPMANPSKYQMQMFNKFRFVAPDSAIPAMTADAAGPDRRGSICHSSPAAFAFRMSRMLQQLLNTSSLSGMGFFEVGTADGRVSQFLASVCGMVCFGVEQCPNGFARNKNAFEKMIASDAWKGKMIPVCFLGNFLKFRNFCGAIVAFGWMQGNVHCESHMLDTFNVDPTCLVLITNWFAPKDHPHWYEDEDGGCTFEFCGTT